MPSASSWSDFLNADRDDLLIRRFREGSADTIIDVRVTNLDSLSLKLATQESPGTTRVRGGERNVASPVRPNVAIPHLSW